MSRSAIRAGFLLIAFLCCTAAHAQDAPTPANRFLLGPPVHAAGPVVVDARFQLQDLLEIDDEQERLLFSGVLTLTWTDPRQAFDPGEEGVDEKVFQGNFQFNEVSTGWFPQLILVNPAAPVDSQGVVLRILPDGRSTLIESFTANAAVKLGMGRFPFDAHHLEAEFELLGFDRDEVVLSVDPDHTETFLSGRAGIPQWRLTGSTMAVREQPSADAGRQRVSTTLVVGVDVERRPFYMCRLVVVPLVVIVLLSFSVFWMDRSSLGDRISVSFIGILTGVAYQMMVSDSIPHISYFTLIHGFLNLSFFTMCATVVINLRVGKLDLAGRHDAGDRIDRRCRWIFPLVYFGLILVMLIVAFRYF